VKPLHSQRVTLWFGISTFCIAGLYFFEDKNGSVITVTSDRYVDMMNEFLFSELRCCYIDLATNWFLQDEAAVRTIRQAMNVLKNMSEHCIISCYGEVYWPANLPDLSVCRLFCWASSKAKCQKYVRQNYINSNREFLTRSMPSRQAC
jgi:hypothetical protein